MALTQEQIDKIDITCIEIRDTCGRIMQRERELPTSSIEELIAIRDRIRSVNNALRW